jgi:hypothetical protein
MTLPLILSLYFILHILFGVSSSKWPHVKGHLLELKVDERKYVNKFPSLMDDVKYCIIKLKYEYEVDGKLYKGSRINYGKDNSYVTPEELESSEFFSNIRNGNFLVYYLKSLPQIATLRTGISNMKNHIIGIGFIMFFGSLVYLMYVVSLSVLRNTAK